MQTHPHIISFNMQHAIFSLVGNTAAINQNNPPTCCAIC